MAPPPSARNALSTGLLRAAINGLEGNRKIGSNASKGQRQRSEGRELQHEPKPVQTGSRHKLQPRSSKVGNSSGSRRGSHSRRSRQRSSKGRRRGKRSCRHESSARASEDKEEPGPNQTKDKRAKLEDKASVDKSAERQSPESDSPPSTLRTVKSSRLADEHADMLVLQRRQHLEEARKRLEAEYERVKADETKKCRRETAERRTREELSELHRKRQAEREAAERMAASRRREPASDKAGVSIPPVITGVDSEAPPRGDSVDSSGSAASESSSKEAQQVPVSAQPNNHIDEMANSEVPTTKVALMDSDLLAPCTSQEQSKPDPPEEACDARIASPTDAKDAATTQHASMAVPPVAPQTGVADALEARSEVAAQESDCALDDSEDLDIAEEDYEEAPDQRAARLSRHRCSLMSCMQEDEEDPI